MNVPHRNDQSVTTEAQMDDEVRSTEIVGGRLLDDEPEMGNGLDGKRAAKGF